MSAGKKKKHTGRKILCVLVLAAACTAGGLYYTQQQGTETVPLPQTYQQEKVRRGSVVSGIQENGTVTFGSNSQIFTVAEITEVTVSSDDSGSSTSSAGTAGGISAGSSMGGGMGGAEAMMSMGMDQGAVSMGSAGSQGQSSSSSGTETSLVVEEIYVAAGQVVETGDPILKITEESILKYREELEASVASAELNVRKETINVESKKSEADYTYEMYLANGETAQATYDATITSLENAVTDLKEELEESSEALAELEEDEANGEDVEEELEEERLNYETLEAELQVAENNLKTQSIEAKQTYENAMTNYKYADELYAIDTDGLEDDLNEAKEVLADTQEALDDFNSQIGDGIIYAEYSGSITSIAYAEGDALSNEAEVVSYTDSEEVSMAVSVTQDDIAGIAVNDEVIITLTPYDEEEFSGVVSSIESASSMGSTVTYNVTARFTGDTAKIYSGMTGEVTFSEKSVSDVLYISNQAVYLKESRSYVKVLQEDGTIQEIKVETGFSDGDTVEILSGLTEGDTVIIESQVTG